MKARKPVRSRKRSVVASVFASYVDPSFLQGAIWPSIVARKERCYVTDCRRCGKSMVSETFLRYVGFCPRCRSLDIEVSDVGHDHFWALRIVPQPMIKIGRNKLFQKIDVVNVMGPFEDEISAIVSMAKDRGLFMPRASA